MPITLKASFATKPTESEPGLLGVQISGSGAVQKSINVVLLIDTSGSMSRPLFEIKKEDDDTVEIPTRISSVLRTLVVLLSVLKTGDTITLVTFNTHATMIFKEIVITEAPEQIPMMIEEINKIGACGETNLSSGVILVGEELKTSSKKADAIVVLTDGDLTVGITQVTGIRSLFESYPIMKGAPIYTLGYGTDHKANFLKGLSEPTHGIYTFISSETMLAISIGEMLASMKTLVANKISLVFHPSIICLELSSSTFPSGTFEIGSIIEGQPKWAIFKVPFGFEASPFVLKWTEAEKVSEKVFIPADGECSAEDILVQELRSKNSKVFAEVSNLSKNHQFAEAKQIISKSLEHFDAFEFRSNPLAIMMRAQLAGSVDEIEKAILGHAGAQANVAYRTAGYAGNYSSQGGVTADVGGQTPGLFSSPACVDASQQMVRAYHTPGAPRAMRDVPSASASGGASSASASGGGASANGGGSASGGGANGGGPMPPDDVKPPAMATVQEESVPLGAPIPSSP